MTPAEAARTLDGIRNDTGGRARLRLVGSVDNPEAQGPGARLQAARLAAGFSIVQVAGALKLTPAQVAAVEAMQFSKLPGLGYALGYARAYGELMELADVDGLVDAFKDAWSPQQSRREAEKAAAPRGAMVPLGVIVGLAALLWLLAAAVMQGSGPKAHETVAPPDEAIKAWASTAPETPGRPVVAVEPETTLKALRDVRVSLRGEDGALVVERILRSGERISTDGLGRWFVTAPDGGALEASGHGQTVKVGQDGIKVEAWRVPDFAGIADAKAREAAEAAKAEADAAAAKAAGASKAR